MTTHSGDARFEGRGGLLCPHGVETYLVDEFEGIFFDGSGDVSCNALKNLVDIGASWAGSGAFAQSAGVFINVATLGVWSGAGNMSAQGVKPPNHISARFSGQSTMNVVMVAPRLTASARFVGDGAFRPRANSAAFVLSTQHTRRLSFPVNPNVPFVRRESATYHHGSARFAGAGRVVAAAS